MESTPVARVEVHELTAERWPDLEALFAIKGAQSGCWCMWWRLPNKPFRANGSEGNRAALRSLTEEGTPSGLAPGLIGYADGQPVGWISLGPRSEYSRFATMTSNRMGPVDATPVWSIVCFYTRAGFRRMGVSAQMLEAAIGWARQHGAQTLEAYANDVGVKASSAEIFMGTVGFFRDAGFEEVARFHPDRPIMRLHLE